MNSGANNFMTDIPISWDTLVNICGDDEMVESIVEVFKEEGLYTLEMIEKGAAGRDAAELKLYCHRMKGTARYLGDDDFVQICLDAELAADEGDVDRAIELSEKIKPVTQKYLEFFERDDWMQILKAKSV